MKNKASIYYPSAEVIISTETSNLVIKTEIDENPDVDKDILSIVTNRSMGVDSPTFTMNLVYRQAWFESIASNDLVIIKMCRPPETLDEVFVGLVDDVRRNIDFSQGKPQRVITITGRGFCKPFACFNLGIVNEVEMSEQYLGYLGKEVTLENCPANEAINQLIKTYADTYIDYNFADGTSLFTRLQLLLTARPDYTILNVTGLLNYQGSLWNLMKEIQNAPFNEMYWEIHEHQPTLILRPTPFNEDTWNQLTLNTITAEDYINESIGRSDVETYTLYSVNCSVMYSGQNQSSTFGYVPLWYPKYFKKYGIRRLDVYSLYTMYAGTPDAEVAELRSMECTKDLFNWNIKNNSMFNGNIIVRGSNKYKIGTRVIFDFEDMEFYVEKVTHIFNVFDSYKTTLGLTRGLPPTQRFTEPFNKYETFDPAVFTPESNGRTGTSSGDIDGATLGSGSPNEIVEYAKTFLGVPYLWKGTTPAGFDCSGFVQYVYAHFGFSLPRTTYEQVNYGAEVDVNDSSKWMPGDLVFYYPGANGPSHVGIYVGNGQKIHSPQSGEVITINPAGSPCAVRRITK